MGWPETDEPDDADLVAAALAGDQDAFAVLATRHRPMVLALVSKMLSGAGLAADAVSEATVAALVSLDRLRSAERFGAWYGGIALNVARRWLRELGAAGAAGPLPEARPDSGPGPDEQAEAAVLASRVRRAVAALAPGHFYWQGLTHAEAATELGISPGAVKARLHQARAALTGELTPLMEDDKKEVRPMAATAAAAAWIDVLVAEVRRADGDDPASRQHVIVLRERSGSRELPIWAGSAEAIALACTLEAVESPRPMTYQLTASLLRAADAPVAEVRITRIVDGVFYAAVAVQAATGRVEVDARPSDALNLALVAGCPIRVDAAIMNDVDATGEPGRWQALPTGASDLAAEVRESQEALLATIAAQRQARAGRTDR